MMENRRMEAVLLVLILGQLATALEVPLDLPQPPTITQQSPKDHIIDPRENIRIHCEAKGNPHPSFSWTKDGIHFDTDSDSSVTMKQNHGTLEVDISRARAENYEGVYQCTARNSHGTAVSNNIVVRQSRSPLWSKDKIRPMVVQEGVSLVLPCRPPAGLPPPIIFWMDNNFQKLPQSKRVSQSLNGDLYFSNVLREDTRNDYICYARFTHTQTIQQKQPITVKVLNLDAINDTMAAFYNDTDLFSEAPADDRKPTFLTPSGPSSSMMVLRGHTLEMECIAEGLPTPDISWTKVSGDLPEQRVSFQHFNKTLLIKTVSESDAGEYRCTARNPLGSVHHTISVTVKAAPYWIIGPPKNLVLAPGEDGVLTCRASGIPKPTITWAMNGIPIENSPEDLSRKVEDDMIIFTGVQTGSSAVYQCNISNQYGYLLSNAFVNVLSESPRVLTPFNKIYQVIKNHQALLDCSSFGSPIPKIKWFKDASSSTLDGDPYILHSNGTLEIPVAQAQNSGKYICVASNFISNSENHVHLEVKEPTRILKQPEHRTVQRGRSVVFECTVKHDPSLIPTMTWLKDDGELPDDERFIVESDRLTITDVTEADAGMYTCIMNTTLDHDSATSKLTVVEKPDPPTDLELTDQKKRSVQLTWTPGDEHNSPIQQFLIEYQDSLHHRGHWHNLTSVPGTETTAHLKLSPYVHYNFRVLALNSVGYSHPSHPSRMYKTDPAAPDENPSDVHGFGTEHDNLVISWKPLSSLQSNGPGLHYEVSWRQKRPGMEWTTETVANNSKYIVSGTPTFVPYEIKVKAVNNYGAGPEPTVVVGFSGEDLPKAVPENVRAVVINSTLARVHWDPVPPHSVRGHLKGYKVYYWREHSLHKHHPDHTEKDILTFSGNHTHGMLPGLHPFSAYFFEIKAYNSKGEGPPSPKGRFKTPEGVPGPPASLVVTNQSHEALTLEWSPPIEHNGHITGYTLKYQPVNNSNELGPEEEMALPANETSVTLHNLKYSKRYKFVLNAKTNRGAGPTISQEAFTIMDEAVASRQVDIATQGWFIGLMCAIALLILILLIICFIQRNKGGKYPVKEKEDAHTDPEFQPMKDDDCTFVEYSDNEDHKPLKGSRTPSNGTVKRDDSDDSLVDYGEGGDGQFNEDGSFIGQYSGKSSCRDNTEGPESSEAPSPINAMNSLNSFV
ncbi:neuronal cell adhesion molecule isoform X10 [Nothobranchius furzeri]|uniref:Transcript variant X12 n=1 Tax=Nothobranchius furzeri TaxID=105023 RepID=A0A9D2YNG4_NOTFU|nr:neuronal cell adhesion molecule isoform X12 [Nothobranchius furzeri]KAF7224114.1 transcript variant X12 [Nothobranchius furzeri]